MVATDSIVAAGSAKACAILFISPDSLSCCRVGVTAHVVLTASWRTVPVCLCTEVSERDHAAGIGCVAVCADMDLCEASHDNRK